MTFIGIRIKGRSQQFAIWGHKCFALGPKFMSHCYESLLTESGLKIAGNDAVTNHLSNDCSASCSSTIEMSDIRLLNCQTNGVCTSETNSENAYWCNAHDAAIAGTLSVSTMSRLCCSLVTCLAQHATSVDANVYCIFVPSTEKLPNRVNIEAATRDEGLCQGHSHLCVVRKFAWLPIKRATTHHLTHATKNWFWKPTKPLSTRTKLKRSTRGVTNCGTND